MWYKVVESAITEPKLKCMALKHMKHPVRNISLAPDKESLMVTDTQLGVTILSIERGIKDCKLTVTAMNIATQNQICWGAFSQTALITLDFKGVFQVMDKTAGKGAIGQIFDRGSYDSK